MAELAKDIANGNIELEEMIIAYAKRKCEQQRAVCAENYHKNSNKVSSADDKLKLILDAPLPNDIYF